MPEKLRKVSDRLYEEEWEKGEKRLDWRKRFEKLQMTLFDVQAERGVSLEVKGVSLLDQNQVRPERSIRANAQFEDSRTIGLIDGNRSEPNTFESAYVFIHPTQEWNETADGDFLSEDGESLGQAPQDAFAIRPGSLLHVSAENLQNSNDEETEQYLSISLYMPEIEFDAIWQPIFSGVPLEKVSLHVFLDVFMSEVERILTGPYQQQTYYIERESSNMAFLIGFSLVSRRICAQAHN